MQPRTKTKIAIGLSSAALMAGAMRYAEPPSKDATERNQQNLQRDLGDLSDSQDRDVDRHRDDRDTLLNGTIKDRNTPGEHRPPQPHLRLRVVP